MSKVDRIQFFAFSADKSAGRGVGDVIKTPNEYSELDNIKNWRRIFSSLWTHPQTPISYNGLKYISFEHAFQSAKFIETGYHKVAKEFSIESQSDLSKKSGLTAFRNRKKVILDKSELEKWRQNQSKIKDEITWAKYNQIEVAKRALLATKNAEIWNKGPRIREIRCFRTEKIRSKLTHK